MDRKIVPLHMIKEGVIANYEKKLKYIGDKRSSHIEYKDSKDEKGAYLLPLIKYDIFDKYEEIYHGFTTRLGGVSNDFLSSMNLSFSRGDKEENVRINHKRVADMLGYKTDSLVFSNQVHETTIYTATKEDCGKGITIESDIREVDGLITNVPGVTLITFFADCVPNYFYDPVNKVVALAHSGWKGTVKGIGSIMVERMKSEFGSNPEDIICAIGPSICKDCYEVSADVAKAFENFYSTEQYMDMIFDKGNDKYMLDLHKACRYNLLNAGIKSDNIAMPDFCTCCNPDFLYSHRASKGLRGNLAAIIGIKE